MDGRGNIYVNGGCDFVPGAVKPPGVMIVTSDHSMLIVSESFANRLTAFDIAADGGLSNRRVWAQGVERNACLRARAGGRR